MDLLVEDKIIVELKSVETVQPVHHKQVLTYLRLAKKPLGLLVNFNEALLKDGITRVANATLAHGGPEDGFLGPPSAGGGPHRIGLSPIRWEISVAL